MQQINVTPIEHLPNFRVGTKVQISSQDGKIRFLTSLVGVHDQDVIVAHLPTAEELLEKCGCSQVPLQWYEAFFRVKQELILRLVDKGIVYAFETSVMEVTGKKSRMIILNYPAKVYQQELRKEPRYPCTLLAQVHCRNEQFEGVVKDVSTGGCQIRLQNPNARNRVMQMKNSGFFVTFEILLPDNSTYFVFKGDLISVISLQYGLRLGIAFKSEYNAIKQYLGALHLN